MARRASYIDGISTRHLLLRQVRGILLISLLGGAAFAALEIAALPAPLPPPFYVKLLGISLTLLGFVVVGRPWAVRRARLLTAGIVALAYGLTALSGMSAPSREYATTAVLFVGAALTTATIMPWGLWPQIVTTAVGALCLIAAVCWSDGNLQQLASDPGAAVVICFAISGATAYEVDRYRLAHRRELHVRLRAESALRRLNTRLEEHVAERTAALELANHAVRRQQADLAHVLRLHTMGEMAAALAHEINQPLCAITNYAQGGVQRLRAGVAETAELLGVFGEIAHEGLRATMILRGIRTLVQRASGANRAVDVNALAADAVRVLEPQARLHGVTVRLESGGAVPAVHADGTQIEQVILNLMLNGVEAAALQSTSRREVVVATSVTGDAVEVAVTDNGDGIAASVAERLFTPFLTTKTGGLGLGLAISRSIVESHGGKLWASPDRSRGTTFLFSLPIGGDAATAAGDRMAERII
jgi:signal transduction histidine kinase